jgi:hypothetical protein
MTVTITPRLAMTSAWDLARRGAAKFGGSPRLYLACSLKLVYRAARWADGRGRLPALKGSDKQIAWASDIRARVIPAALAAAGHLSLADRAGLFAVLASYRNASTWIDQRGREAARWETKARADLAKANKTLAGYALA